MTSPSSGSEESSFESSIQEFLNQFSANILSKSAKISLDKLSASSGLSEKETSKLRALQSLFSIRFQEKFRKSDPKSEQLSPPSGMAFGPNGRLVLSDDFNHRVQIYDKDFNLVTAFGSKGKGDGELTYPRGLAVDSEGSIYVADSWNHRIQKFDSEGRHLRTIGGYGDGKGEFNEPYDILIQRNGGIVVVERYNHRIQFFDANLVSQGWMGTRGTELEDHLAQVYDTEPKLFPRPVFEFPTSLAKDSHGCFYLTDSGNHRVIKFDSQWNIIGYLGTQGSEACQFEYPLCVTVGSQDYIYVTDLNNNRVQVFASSGRFLYAFGEASGSESLGTPSLIAVGPDNKVFVATTFEPVVSVYSVDPLENEDLGKALLELYEDDIETTFQRGQNLESASQDEAAFEVYAQSLTDLTASQNSFEFREETGFRDALEIPITFVQLSNKLGAEKTSGHLIIESLKFYDLQMEKASQNLLNHLASWQKVADIAIDEILKEESRILAQQEDPLIFNKELYLADKEEKEGFHEVRELSFEYRRIANRKWTFFNEVLCGDSSVETIQECLKIQTNRWLKVCGHMVDLLTDKEKREESMFQDFSEMNNNEEKWKNFRSKLQTNQRLFWGSQNFIFEVRTLFSAFKSIWLKSSEPLFRQFIADLFKNPDHLLEIHRILLGIQEDWPLLGLVENDYADILDGIILFDTNNKNFPVRTLEVEEFSPIPHDYEKTIPSETLRNMTFEIAPIEKVAQGLLCANEILTIDSLETCAEDIAEKLGRTLENIDTFEKTSNQLMTNMENLVLNKIQMETSLSKTDPRDKKAPIPIRNNLQALEFQTALIKRMIKTLEINETHNLIRLIRGTALLTSESGVKDLKEVQTFIELVENYKTSLGKQIFEINDQIKDKTLERGKIEIELSTAIFQGETGEIDRAGQLKEEKIRIDLKLDRLKFNCSRYVKVLKLLTKIDAIKESKPESKKFSMEIQYSFSRTGVNCGQLLFPTGMAQNSKGEIFVIDHDKNQVFVYSSSGILRRTIGRQGNASGSFNGALTLQFDKSDNFYVVDTLNKRIQKFDSDGKFLLSFGDQGPEENRLCEVYSMSLDESGNAWVADHQPKRIVIFDTDGVWVKEIKPKPGQDTWDEPIAVCCIEGGDYFVADKSDASLRRCSPQGETIAVLDKAGIDVGLLYYLHYDKRFGLFASDYLNKRVLLLDEMLKPIYIYDCPGNRLGESGKITAVSTFGNQLFAVDCDHHRIQVFNIE
jgi:DNA-binding beta-propeller fold protein YncE